MMSLKQKSIKGLTWDMASTLAQQGIGFIISIFLARLLEPSEFGLVGMALVFISISQVFSDFGFASALIQNKKNTSLTYSSIFYVNIVSGLVLFGIFQLLAPVIGNFYESTQVTDLVRWLALSFILSSFNQVQRTILRRNIDFKKLTIRSIIAQGLSGMVGVYLALKGWGVYALVFQNLAGSVIDTLILWRVTNWYPKAEFSWRELKKLSRFSLFIFFDQIASTIFQKLDILFIGKFFSAATLGFYTRAESLNNLVTKYSSRSLTNVFYPVLSAIQTNEEQFNKVYLKVISVISFLSFFLTGLLILWGETIIITLFGEKWTPSISIFKIMAVSAFVYPINSMMVNAFLSKGKSRENFYIGLFRKAFRLIPLAAGYFYGLDALLWSMASVYIFLTVTNACFLNKYLKVSFILHLKKLFEGALPLGVFFFIKITWLDQFSYSNSILINSLSFICLYFCLNFLMKNEGMLFILFNVKSTFVRFYGKIS